MVTDTTADTRAPPRASLFHLSAASFFAQSADQIALAVAPLVAVIALGATAAEAGSLQTVLTLPFLLLAIPAGLLADRMSRRSLMMAGEAVRALSLAATVAIAAAGGLTWPLLALLGFVGVSGTVVFSVAAPTVVPALVAPSLLGRANSRIELARTLAYAVGPAAGGALVGWLGGGAAFAVATALSLAAIAHLALLPDPGRPAPRKRKPIADIREGLAFVFRHPLLGPIFATQCIFNAAFSMILAVFVPYAVANLGLSAAATGTTLSMFGIGMVVGAAVAPLVLRFAAFGRVIAIGPACGLAGSVLIAATIWLPYPGLAAAGLFLFGVGPILWTISTTTLRQSVTPSGLLGRVSAISILSVGARPFGAGLAALVAAFHSVEACLVIAVAGFVAQAAIILVSPAVGLAEQPEPVSA